MVAPEQVVICEGSSVGKNREHDATCYSKIFSDDFPDTKFVSGGNCHDLEQDRLALLGAIKALAKGVKIIRLLDRDDRSDDQVSSLSQQHIKVLPRRHLECFLFDDEVLRALCRKMNKSGEADAVIQEKEDARQASIQRGHPRDDLKSAAGEIYVRAKKRLGLVGCGNDASAFQRDTLAKLVKPGMQVYKELRQAIFE